MTIYKGTRITAANFFKKMQEILLAEGYEDKSNPNNDSKVFLTTGVDGKSPFYVYLANSTGGAINIGIYEAWDGVATLSGEEHPCITWHASSSSTSSIFDYTINITKDRIIIAVSAVQAVSGLTSLTYAGLIKRYDPADIGGGAATLTFTTRHKATSTGSTIPLLRDRSNRPLNEYGLAYTSGNSPTGWGNKLLTCPIYVAGTGNGTSGNSEEGLRGELHDLLYTHRDAPYQTGDIVTHEGNQYMAVRTSSYRGYRGLYPYLFLLKV